MTPLADIKRSFGIQWELCRAKGFDRILPERFEIDNDPPSAGYDGEFVGVVAGVAHFRLSLSYAPPLGVSWTHRYLHEIGHAILGILKTMFPDGPYAADNYLRTRHWAWRYRGSIIVPGSWQQAQSEARDWNALPNEMWAESFVAAIEPTQRERTFNWGILPPLDGRGFFIGLSREVSPVVYPSPPGETLIAKSLNDDSLFFYEAHTPWPPVIRVRDGAFNRLGDVVKWW